MRIAVPSKLPGGLEAAVDGHFGHSEAFTIITLQGDRVADVQVAANSHHGPGGCGAPVRELADSGVNALIVGGIGIRPLSMLRTEGIAVYLSRAATVGEAVAAFSRGELPKFDDSLACAGHGSGHCRGH